MPGYSKKRTETFAIKKSELPSVVDVIQSSENHKTLAKLLKDAKLVNALKAADTITVFAPIDAAFKGISVPEDQLKQILLFHVLQYSSAPPPNVKSMKSFKTLHKSARLQASAVSSYIKSKPVKASNGVLYVTDKVLIP